ncbi:MAG: glycosyltransferase [Clostridium sp.]|nr:glycosyltransferase [Clostridium sp.]
MNDKLSIILILFDKDDLYISLDSIRGQTFKNYEVFILTTEQIDLPEAFTDERHHMIIVDSLKTVFQHLLPLSESLTGNFITYMNSNDTSAASRFEKQINYMNKNNLNICSCLELPKNSNEKDKKALDESNKFIKADDINSVISSAYLPLDFYTFVIKKDFLIKIVSFSTLNNFESEIDMILFFLKYEDISKLPQILYYVKHSRIPYKESLYYYDGPNTTNKLAIFNRNNTLENKSYTREIFNSKKELDTQKNKEYKRTILAVLTGVYVGGTETYIISLANRLKRENIRLCIITKYCVNTDNLLFNDIPIYVINLRDINEWKKLSSSINNVSLIQIHYDSEVKLCPMLKSLFNVPITVTFHGIYYNLKLIKAYLKYIDEFVFVSSYVKEYYNKLLMHPSSSKYTIIPNGIEVPDKSEDNISEEINLRKSLSIPENSLIFLYCSRMSFNKADMAVRFLKCFDDIADENKNIYAVIIGSGIHEFIVKDAYKNDVINKDKVFLLGTRFNMPAYYAESDIVIGTGRVALEAMSIGRPVISLGSNCEVNIVSSENIDVLVQSNFGDHFSEDFQLNEDLIIRRLKECMNLLINSADKLKELGEWSCSYVKNNLSLEKLARYYIDKCNEY